MKLKDMYTYPIINRDTDCVYGLCPDRLFCKKSRMSCENYIPKGL